MLLPEIFDDNLTNGLFDDLFDFPFAGSRNYQEMMQTDVKDNGNEYELSISMPGFEKKDLKAELKDGYMTISGEHKENKDEKDGKGKYIRRERYTGHCSRTFYVGKDVKEEDVKAKFENGVLTLTMPKEAKKPEVENKKLIAIEG